MLCSSSGNFCVQALNGIEGYQDGKWIKTFFVEKGAV